MCTARTLTNSIVPILQGIVTHNSARAKVETHMFGGGEHVLPIRVTYRQEVMTKNELSLLVARSCVIRIRATMCVSTLALAAGD